VIFGSRRFSKLTAPARTLYSIAMQERRRADLLAKRQKLEEMREMRKAREASRTNARQEEVCHTNIYL